jgi:hypothetical protein
MALSKKAVWAIVGVAGAVLVVAIVLIILAATGVLSPSGGVGNAKANSFKLGGNQAGTWGSATDNNGSVIPSQLAYPQWTLAELSGADFWDDIIDNSGAQVMVALRSKDEGKAWKDVEQARVYWNPLVGENNPARILQKMQDTSFTEFYTNSAPVDLDDTASGGVPIARALAAWPAWTIPVEVTIDNKANEVVFTGSVELTPSQLQQSVQDLQGVIGVSIEIIGRLKPKSNTWRWASTPHFGLLLADLAYDVSPTQPPEPTTVTRVDPAAFSWAKSLQDI